MHRTPLSIPEIAIIAGTRAALGAGVALLLGDRLSREQRRAIGWTLVGIGAITTIPIASQLFGATGDEPSHKRTGLAETLPARDASWAKKSASHSPERSEMSI